MTATLTTCIESNATFNTEGECGGMVSMQASPFTGETHPMCAVHFAELTYEAAHATDVPCDEITVVKSLIGMPTITLHCLATEGHSGSHTWH